MLSKRKRERPSVSPISQPTAAERLLQKRRKVEHVSSGIQSQESAANKLLKKHGIVTPTSIVEPEVLPQKSTTIDEVTDIINDNSLSSARKTRRIVSATVSRTVTTENVAVASRWTLNAAKPILYNVAISTAIVMAIACFWMFWFGATWALLWGLVQHMAVFELPHIVWTTLITMALGFSSDTAWATVSIWLKRNPSARRHLQGRVPDYVILRILGRVGVTRENMTWEDVYRSVIKTGMTGSQAIFLGPGLASYLTTLGIQTGIGVTTKHGSAAVGAVTSGAKRVGSVVTRGAASVSSVVADVARSRQQATEDYLFGDATQSEIDNTIPPESVARRLVEASNRVKRDTIAFMVAGSESTTLQQDIINSVDREVENMKRELSKEVEETGKTMQPEKKVEVEVAPPSVDELLDRFAALSESPKDVSRKPRREKRRRQLPDLPEEFRDPSLDVRQVQIEKERKEWDRKGKERARSVSEQEEWEKEGEKLQESKKEEELGEVTFRKRKKITRKLKRKLPDISEEIEIPLEETKPSAPPLVELPFEDKEKPGFVPPLSRTGVPILRSKPVDPPPPRTEMPRKFADAIRDNRVALTVGVTTIAAITLALTVDPTTATEVFREQVGTVAPEMIEMITPVVFQGYNVAKESTIVRTSIINMLIEGTGVGAVLDRYTDKLTSGEKKEIRNLAQAIKAEKDKTRIRQLSEQMFGVLTGGYRPFSELKKMSRVELKELYAKLHPHDEKYKNYTSEKLRRLIAQNQMERIQILGGIISGSAHMAVRTSTATMIERTITVGSEQIQERLEAIEREERKLQQKIEEEKAEVARIAEVERLAREEELERLAEQKRLEEAAAEAKRLEEEAKAEAKRLEEEAKAEAKRLEEEAKRAREEAERIMEEAENAKREAMKKTAKDAWKKNQKAKQKAIEAEKALEELKRARMKVANQKAREKLQERLRQKEIEELRKDAERRVKFKNIQQKELERQIREETKAKAKEAWKKSREAKKLAEELKKAAEAEKKVRMKEAHGEALERLEERLQKYKEEGQRAVEEAAERLRGKMLSQKYRERNFETEAETQAFLDDLARTVDIVIINPDGTAHPIVPDDILMPDSLRDVSSFMIRPIIGEMAKEAAKATEHLIPGYGWYSAARQVGNIGMAVGETAKDVYKIHDLLTRLDQGENPLEIDTNYLGGYLDEAMSLRAPSLAKLIEDSINLEGTKMEDIVLRALKDQVMEGWDVGRLKYEIGKNFMKALTKGDGNPSLDFQQSLGGMLFDKVTSSDSTVTWSNILRRGFRRE